MILIYRLSSRGSPGLSAPRGGWLLVICLALASPRIALSHGTIHEQIASISVQIAADPENSAFFLKRGELHRVHGDLAAALSDYQRSLELGEDPKGVEFCRGSLLAEAGFPYWAKLLLDRVLAFRPADVEALVTRARLQRALGEFLGAADDFTEALAAFDSEERPYPGIFLERARALAAIGEDRIPQAIEGLDQGIEKLGPAVTLLDFACELEMRIERYQAALVRLERIRAQSTRNEMWLARQGEVLERLGRTEDARVAFEEALTALRKLPQRHGRTRMARDLERKLNNDVERLRSASGNSKKESETHGNG